MGAAQQLIKGDAQRPPRASRMHRPSVTRVSRAALGQRAHRTELSEAVSLPAISHLELER